VQVCELACYLVLLADWSVLTDGSRSWQPLAVLLCTMALPVVYSRRIVDFAAGSRAC
jgi:hypothetical protein